MKLWIFWWRKVARFSPYIPPKYTFEHHFCFNEVCGARWRKITTACALFWVIFTLLLAHYWLNIANSLMTVKMQIVIIARVPTSQKTWKLGNFWDIYSHFIKIKYLHFCRKWLLSVITELTFEAIIWSKWTPNNFHNKLVVSCHNLLHSSTFL